MLVFPGLQVKLAAFELKQVDTYFMFYTINLKILFYLAFFCRVFICFSYFCISSVGMMLRIYICFPGASLIRHLFFSNLQIGEIDKLVAKTCITVTDSSVMGKVL